MSDHKFNIDFVNDAFQYVLTGGAGVVGHIMYNLHLIQKGERKPWWWVLCGMCIALVTGWTVLGLGEWADIPYKATQSLAIIAGWGGPHLIDQAINRAIDRWIGPSSSTDEA